MNIKDIKIGDKYRIIENRSSWYGRCKDMIKIEGEIVKINGIDESSSLNNIYIISKNGGHICQIENLETIEENQIAETIQEKENDMKGIKLADLLTTLINDPNFSNKYHIFIYKDGEFHSISEIDVYNMKIWCTDDYECTFSECEEYELWVK